MQRKYRRLAAISSAIAGLQSGAGSIQASACCRSALIAGVSSWAQFACSCYPWRMALDLKRDELVEGLPDGLAHVLENEKSLKELIEFTQTAEHPDYISRSVPY